MDELVSRISAIRASVISRWGGIPQLRQILTLSNAGDFDAVTICAKLVRKFDPQYAGILLSLGETLGPLACGGRITVGPTAVGGFSGTPTTFGWMILQQWVEEFMVASGPQDLWVKYVESIVDFLSSAGVDFVRYAPLYGVKSDSLPIDLPVLGFQIVPLPNTIARSIQNMGLFGQTVQLDTEPGMPAVQSRVVLSRHLHDADAQLGKERKRIEDEKGKLLLLLDGLRLSASGNIVSPGFAYDSHQWETCGGGLVMNFFQQPVPLIRNYVNLTQSEVSRAEAIAVRITQNKILANSTGFRNALLHFNRSFLRDPLAPEEIILDVAIASESLILNAGGKMDKYHSELSYRFRLWGSYLVAPTDGVLRPKAENHLKRLYDMRSKIAHGAGINYESTNASDKRTVADVKNYERFRDLFRCAVLNFILLAEQCAKKDEKLSLHSLVTGQLAFRETPATVVLDG